MEVLKIATRNNEKRVRVNNQIRADKVRAVMPDGEQLVLTVDAAIQKAESFGLDLVEVSPNAEPPVCKIMDYGKFLYKQEKKKKDSKKNQKRVTLKEIKLRPFTEEHDFSFKKKHIETFIQKGFKVRIRMQFRGRELAHIDIGSTLMKRLIEELKETAKVEMEPKMSGRMMIMVFAPIN